MERNGSASLAVDGERICGRAFGQEPPASALGLRLPTAPVEIFRDLGMSRSAIAAYFRRFPDLHRD